jgi:hypothetical protein
MVSPEKSLMGHGKQSEYNRKTEGKSQTDIQADIERHNVQYDNAYMANLASISFIWVLVCVP